MFLKRLYLLLKIMKFGINNSSICSYELLLTVVHCLSVDCLYSFGFVSFLIFDPKTII